MAIFHMPVKIIGRADGFSVTAAAAYRARCAIFDERTGERHDYRPAVRDLAFAGIFAPKDAPEWAKDRAALWNHVEGFEKRRDAQLAREFEIGLPHELTLEQNQWLLQDFIKENFTRRGLIADVAIHAPREDKDDRNIHAHVLVTMRRLDGQEFARKKDRDLNDRSQMGVWRESWARHANHHLERWGHDARIDHRTLQAQGIDREPQVHLGKHAAAMERDGVDTLLGAVNRELTAHGDNAPAPDRARAAVHAAIRDCWDRSDTGAGFDAALVEQGLILARGDQAPLVVLDTAGAVYPLGPRLLDCSVAAFKAHTADLERADLPSVAEVRAELARDPVREVARGVEDFAEDVVDVASTASGLVGGALGSVIRVAEEPLNFLIDFLAGPATPRQSVPRAAPREEAPASVRSRASVDRSEPTVAASSPEVREQVAGGQTGNLSAELQMDLLRRATEIAEAQQERARDGGRER